eukprot:GHVO01032881.1.p1 GENE.GHVO01032881.1~~GHVO01032881.1.p1  ORF type:complete len:260 (-),score=36.24 GHVO01032881.1:85-810(-)
MNKCLDIAGMDYEGREESGCRVQLFVRVDVRNQQWYEDTNGIIRSIFNDMALFDKTGLDTDMPSLYVDPYDPNLGHCFWTCRNGNTVYNMRYNKYLDSDLKAQDAPETWKMIMNARPFNLMNSESGKVLDILGRNKMAGTQIFLYKKESNGSLLHQQWYEDPYGFIRSKLNGLALDTKDGTLRAQPFDWDNDHCMWTLRDGSLYNTRLQKYLNRYLEFVDENVEWVAQERPYTHQNMRDLE